MIQICTDFDGTITTRDTIVYVTEKFGAGEEYRARIVEKIKSGEISVFKGISLELETVKVSWEKAVEHLRNEVFIDRGFEEFVNWSREMEYPMTILSSGMTPVVELYTAHFGIPIFAHKLEVTPEGWRFEVIEEHRKRTVLEEMAEQGPIVYIGDGTSDLEAIPYASLLFARKGRYLEAHCRANGIPCRSFSDFLAVKEKLAAWDGARH